MCIASLREERTTYSGYRDWFDTEKVLRQKLYGLLVDVAGGAKNKVDALRTLAPGQTGERTLYDEFSRLRDSITTDGVITEEEARSHISDLAMRFSATRTSIQSDHAVDAMKGGLKGGKDMSPFAQDPFTIATMAHFQDIRSAARPPS
jgi:hypothetical protein